MVTAEVFFDGLGYRYILGGHSRYFPLFDPFQSHFPSLRPVTALTEGLFPGFQFPFLKIDEPNETTGFFAALTIDAIGSSHADQHFQGPLPGFDPRHGIDQGKDAQLLRQLGSPPGIGLPGRRFGMAVGQNAGQLHFHPAVAVILGTFPLIFQFPQVIRTRILFAVGPQAVQGVKGDRKGICLHSFQTLTEQLLGRFIVAQISMQSLEYQICTS